VGTVADASKSVMKITRVGLPAENGFLDRMVGYLYFKRRAGEEGKQFRPHPAVRV
jgi:hypothetical protein